MIPGTTLRQNVLILKMHTSINLNDINPKELWRTTGLSLLAKLGIASNISLLNIGYNRFQFKAKIGKWEIEYNFGFLSLYNPFERSFK